MAESLSGSLPHQLLGFVLWSLRCGFRWSFVRETCVAASLLATESTTVCGYLMSEIPLSAGAATALTVKNVVYDETSRFRNRRLSLSVGINR
jgi:hypothetical protein